jgi:hypothetical protein
MDNFVSVNGFQAPLTPAKEKKTVQYLFNGDDPPPWQADLAHKILRNGWTAMQKGYIEQFSTKVSSEAAKDTELELRRKILRRLYFEDLPDREYRISAAHQDTFHRIYDGPSHLHGHEWWLFTT